MKVIRLDSKAHDRSKFNCEESSLTLYIQQQASQDVKKELSACFVIINEQTEVVGYYTLNSSSIDREAIPEIYKNKIPANYNVPVILLGRLARDIRMKGTNIGEHLLMDALHRCYKSRENIGSMAVVVDPLSQFAINFYAKYDFELLPDSKKMFLSMKRIIKLFE